MNKIECSNNYDFVLNVMAHYGDCNDLSIYVNTEDAMEIIRELIGQDYIGDEMLHIECMDLDMYDDVVALITLDDDGGIWIENAFGKDKFKIVDSDVIFAESKYYDEVVASNGTDGIDYTAFVIGEEDREEEENLENDKRKIMIATDDEGRICGFKYNDNESDDHCFTIEYCSCTPVDDIAEMIDMCNGLIETYVKFFN